MRKTTIERREFGERPPADELAEWQAWFRAHGIDGRDVPIGEGWAERDGRVVRYVAFVRDGQGRPVFDRVNEWFETEIREVQVYGRRPAPFPVERA